MKVEHIDAGLESAMTQVPSIREAVPLTKCDLADACYAFLQALKPNAGTIGNIAIRAIHGKISEWKRANCA